MILEITKASIPTEDVRRIKRGLVTDESILMNLNACHTRTHTHTNKVFRVSFTQLLPPLITDHLSE